MRVRGLIIAAVLLAALSGALWWSNKKKAAEEAKPPADASPKIADITQTNVVKIAITKKDSPALVLERAPSAPWRITEPKPFGADQDTVNSMLTSLNPLTADKLVEDKAADLAPYGLNAPSLTVAVTTRDGKTTTLLAGDDVPTGGGAFASLAGSSRVYTIPSFAKSSFDKSLNDLRDKRLLTFDSDKLTRVDLAAKGAKIEFGKNNQNEWQILAPKPLRADGLQVDELVRKLKEARMDLSVSDADAKKAASSFASGAPVATATVTDSSGPQTLTVKKDKAGDYYAKSSVVDGVVKVTSDLGQGVDKSLDDFRNKKLFDFGFNEPNQLTIQDGSKSYQLQRTGEDWLSGGKKMDNVSVQNLLDKLRDLSASSFPESGFANPTIHITIVSGDGKKTEKAALAASGANFIAQRENEASLFQIDGKTVKDIQDAAAGVKPAAEKKK